MSRKLLTCVPLAGALLVAAVPGFNLIRHAQRGAVLPEETGASNMLLPDEPRTAHRSLPWHYTSFAGRITEVTTHTGQTRITLTNTPEESAKTLHTLLRRPGKKYGSPAGLRSLTLTRSDALWEVSLQLDRDAVVHGTGATEQLSPAAGDDPRELTALTRVFAAAGPTAVGPTLGTGPAPPAIPGPVPDSAEVATVRAIDTTGRTGFVRLKSGRHMVWEWTGGTLSLEEVP